MPYLTLEIRRHLILQNIPVPRHAEAFGTFCMSRPPTRASHDAPTHVLNMWLKGENRETLLGSCAALLCWDASGKVMILSRPRVCIDDSSADGEVFVIAQRGNAVGRNNIVSIPRSVLHQCVVGFVPERVHPALGKDKILEASCCKGVDVPIYKGSATFMAQLPIVLPLGYGHGIDEDLSKEMIRLKLAASHPFYSIWIDSMSWLCESIKGRSSHGVNESATEGSSSSSASLLLAPSNHEEGSFAWNELHPELDRIRKENLERFLDNNKEYYEEADSSPTTEALIAKHPTCNLQGTASKENRVIREHEKCPTLARNQSSSPANDSKIVLVNEPSPTFDANKRFALPQAVSPSECEMAAGREDEKVIDDAHVPSPRGLSGVDPAVSAPAFARMSPRNVSRPDCATGLQGKSDAEECQVSSPPRLKDSGSAGFAISSINIPWTNTAAKLKRSVELVPPQRQEQRKRPATAAPVGASKKQKSWGKVEDKILTALAEFSGMRMEQPSKLLLALFAGYANPASAGFKQAMKHLEQEDVVRSFGGGAFGLTSLGKKYVPLVNPPTTNAEVHKRLLAVVQKKQKTKKLNELWGELSDGDVHDIKEVASAIGYSNVQSAGFKDAVGALTKIDFVAHDKSSKTLQLAECLFPFGNVETEDDTSSHCVHEINASELNVVSI